MYICIYDVTYSYICGIHAGSSAGPIEKPQVANEKPPVANETPPVANPAAYSSGVDHISDTDAYSASSSSGCCSSSSSSASGLLFVVNITHKGCTRVYMSHMR